MSTKFNEMANELLKSLKIQTQIIKDNKDIQDSRNFSAVLPQSNTKLIMK